MILGLSCSRYQRPLRSGAAGMRSKPLGTVGSRPRSGSRAARDPSESSACLTSCDAFGPTAKLVKDGGRLASTVGGADAESITARSISGINVFGQSDPDAFRTVLRMAGEGALEVPITRTFGFDDLAEALGLVGKRRSRGKLAVNDRAESPRQRDR